MARREPPVADPAAGDQQSPWDQVIEVIGHEVALRLAKDFGGVRLYIPRKPGDHHPVTVSIGPKAAKQLAQAYGGASFDIPLSPGKRARIIELLGKGWKPIRIAREVGCTQRLVYYVQAELRDAAPAEPGLFD